MRRGIVGILVVGLIFSAGYVVAFDVTEESDTEPDGADGSLDVHHIDVGQGDATLVVTPSGETILIDSGEWHDEGETVIDYLESHGIDRIDHLIATSGHDDHLGGYAAVIEQLTATGDGVGTAYDSGVAHTGQSHEAYFDAIRAHNVTLLEVTEGDELAIENDTVEATVLNPPADPGDRADDSDYNSIVLSIEYGEFAYLTTGSAERDAEQRLVEDWHDELPADAYQAGHHGSSIASTEPFLDAVSPEVAIVSSARESPYGYPHEAVLESFADREIETYWTGVHGDIVLRTDGNFVSVTTERAGPTDPTDLLEIRAENQNETASEPAD